MFFCTYADRSMYIQISEPYCITKPCKLDFNDFNYKYVIENKQTNYY